ncbi:unnamed protein product [Vitrella brassicaformis CCMP3155]|uniref:Uncharacterized protein n=1 Tax=Vitrella brassicaformis (strain CCMP3155) TaxID=1169540 RepID=A0A0G4GHZ2_VITBC|nr:unnamed protein product [Vitrella brassicaformis CCMP3155]|eukprot:CEM29375.1 unnamed protein product [Vitrella brassicaformis CCMP3155]
MAQSSSAASQAPPLPPGCRHLNDVYIVPDEGVSALSRQLLEGCIRRTFRDAAQFTQLIEQGADPRAVGGLRVHGTSGRCTLSRCSCLCLAIDSQTNVAFLDADGYFPAIVRVVLPQWSSRQLQRDVINALIDGGAEMNGGGFEQRPITVAVRAGSEATVEALLARQANLRGLRVIYELPDIGSAAPPATRDYEAALMSIYRRLLRHDSTLAAERVGGNSLIHLAATARSIFSQSFIDAYLTLVTSHGADMTATDDIGRTPLHWAARTGSHCVAHWLCRQLTAYDVNRGMPNETPLAVAAHELDFYRRQYQGERRQRRIRAHKTTIGVLLRGGAAPSIARMPTATEGQRRQRQLVLAEYATVLSELSEVVMSAINGALAPQRDHSMLLARLLPLAPHHDGAHPHPSPSNMAFGPHEAEAIAWKIGAFLH